MGVSVALHIKRMVCQKEIIKGTFNPRTYKDDDPVNWAKKRKPEYMVPSGVINYSWERTKCVEDNKEEKEEDEKEEECKEIIIIRKPCDKSKKVVKIPSREDMWPRRMRTDITEHYH